MGSVGAKVVSLLSTGNIVSSTGLDLMQVSGFTVIADRLNSLRYMSHFRAVHRGQFFTTMKTTTVRKLLPESWGLLPYTVVSSSAFARFSSALRRSCVCSFCRGRGGDVHNDNHVIFL